MPYVGTQPNPNQRGVKVEFGFRITDTAAVRRAGFVDAGGEDNFRWLQLLELRRIADPASNLIIQQLRRSGQGRIIDPTIALSPTDSDPYYWDEPKPDGTDEGADYRNKEADNGLCYDWIFYDAPRFNIVAAQIGRRAYFNFETALVGLRKQKNGDTCNVLLNTVLWGFDVIQQGALHELKLNALQAGRYGGSIELRQWFNHELNRGAFPKHHFYGKDFKGKARCS
jgi:hypothetical protein